MSHRLNFVFNYIYTVTSCFRSCWSGCKNEKALMIKKDRSNYAQSLVVVSVEVATNLLRLNHWLKSGIRITNYRWLLCQLRLLQIDQDWIIVSSLVSESQTIAGCCVSWGCYKLIEIESLTRVYYQSNELSLVVVSVEVATNWLRLNHWLVSNIRITNYRWLLCQLRLLQIDWDWIIGSCLLSE
jgi:hypothetical protein